MRLMLGVLGVLLMGASCDPPAPPQPPGPPADCTCVVPASDDPGWKAGRIPSDETPWNVGLFVEGREALGDVCGHEPLQSQTEFAVWAQSKGVCAAAWSDAVLLPRPDGQWEEMHVVSYATGCWASAATVFKGAWVYQGAAARNCGKIARRKS